MNQYRASVYFFWQIGFAIGYDKDYDMITINIPFATINFGLKKNANGVLVFGKEFGIGSL